MNTMADNFENNEYGPDIVSVVDETELVGVSLHATKNVANKAANKVFKTFMIKRCLYIYNMSILIILPKISYDLQRGNPFSDTR